METNDFLHTLKHTTTTIHSSIRMRCNYGHYFSINKTDVWNGATRDKLHTFDAKDDRGEQEKVSQAILCFGPSKLTSCQSIRHMQLIPILTDYDRIALWK